MEAAFRLIRQDLGDKRFAVITGDPDAFACLRELGANLNILAYAFNFKRDGVLNQDLARANELNRLIYARLGLRADAAATTSSACWGWATSPTAVKRTPSPSCAR